MIGEDLTRTEISTYTYVIERKILLLLAMDPQRYDQCELQ